MFKSNRPLAMFPSCLLVASLIAAAAACGSDDDDTAPSGRTFTVEITGGEAVLTDTDRGASLDDDAKGDCAEAFGKDVELVKITGNKSTVSVAPAGVLAIKISGNQNAVNVKIKSDAAAASPAPGSTATPTPTPSPSPIAEKPILAGLCFMLSGNQARATVAVDNFTLSKFVYVASGNQPAADVTVQKNAEIKEMFVKISGNGGTLKVSGEGKYTCPSAVLKGNAGGVECSPK